MVKQQKFGDLITADHKVLNEGGESRNYHRYAVAVRRFGPSMDSILSVQNKNFSGDGKEGTKVPRVDEETKCHLH